MTDVARRVAYVCRTEHGLNRRAMTELDHERAPTLARCVNRERSTERGLSDPALAGEELEPRHHRRNLPRILPEHVARVIAITVLSILVGCYASHEAPVMTPDGCLAELRPACVAREAGPCSPFRAQEAVCVDRRWECPSGTEQHVRGAANRCLPYGDAEGLTRLITVGPALELGSHCVTMINGDVTSPSDDLDHTGVALAPDPHFGACPTTSDVMQPLLDRSVIGPDLIVDVMDTVEARGETYSLVRLFIVDPDAVFGVTAIGSQFVEHEVDGSFAPTPRVRFGDGFYRSMLVRGDTLYLYTSVGDESLTGRVGVGRASVDVLVDESVTVESWDGRAWVVDRDIRFGVFEAGPQFHVSEHPDGRLLVTSVEGFGDRVVMSTAEAPEGPWLTQPRSQPCALPRDDPSAFCDSARALASLWDPTEPSEVVISYRIGSLAEDWEARFAARPRQYWGPIDWVRLR